MDVTELLTVYFSFYIKSEEVLKYGSDIVINGLPDLTLKR